MKHIIFSIWLGGICALPVAWALIIRAYWGRKDVLDQIDRNLWLVTANVCGVAWNVFALILIRLIR